MDNNGLKTFTIVDTESQKTKEIKSNATTVAELKRDLRQNGFNVDGKTIQEALTRTEFKDDTSVLPHDVPYKGSTTNDLVFRLTKANKQVRSGMDRKQAYDEVKRLGLGDAIKAKFGKNFTQVSTNDLIAFINANGKKGAAAPKPAKEAPKRETPAKKETPASGKECKCMDALKNLCSILVDNGTIDETDMEAIFGETPAEAAAPASGSKSKYDKDELNELLSGL
jgi:hypothetical protein